MKTEEIRFIIETYLSVEELSQPLAALVHEARKITQFAYAPYSHFKVGAYAQLVNGQFVSGTNQENASYPAGICAERTLLSVAASLYPEVGIETIAISYENENGKSNQPISPCGICRQSLLEFQERTRQPIQLLLSGMEGKVLFIKNASQLLPLVFSSKDLL